MLSQHPSFRMWGSDIGRFFMTSFRSHVAGAVFSLSLYTGLLWMQISRSLNHQRDGRQHGAASFRVRARLGPRGLFRDQHRRSSVSGESAAALKKLRICPAT